MTLSWLMSFYVAELRNKWKWGETEASWLLSTNTFKEPLKRQQFGCKRRSWKQGHQNWSPCALIATTLFILASIISLFSLPPHPQGSPFCSCLNLVTPRVCHCSWSLALLVSFVKIISWIASRQRRSSRSAVPSDTFSSAKVNLLTGKVPVQTLQTGLIKWNLAAPKWAEENYNVFSQLAPEEKMQIFMMLLN